ncbi:hypothetical protein [Lewinella cohaerens]|uniref:hypothetical protein n=1 Tax=Lewinella cohaerens TaxID=70995 RepID=UPI000374A8DA|nr:hypothetical protein [Lewinella cohaerens]
MHISPAQRLLQLTLILLLLVGIGSLHGQSMLNWPDLADVQFSEKFSNSLGIKYYQANFGEDLKAMEGEEVIIMGYLIPLDALGETYALSKNPFSACFFCGAAGPETVVELRIKAEFIQRYQTDERRAFKGRLQLYESSLEQFNYVLLDAEPL